MYYLLSSGFLNKRKRQHFILIDAFNQSYSKEAIVTHILLVEMRAWLQQKSLINQRLSGDIATHPVLKGVPHKLQRLMENCRKYYT